MTQTKILVAVVAAFACASAFAAEGCKLSLKPTTSGIFLNPTLQKLVVVKATPSSPKEPCPLLVNDELLQINERIIPGANAKEVMAYWKSLPKGTERTFKVRRAGAVISVSVVSE